MELELRKLNRPKKDRWRELSRLRKPAQEKLNRPKKERLSSPNE